MKDIDFALAALAEPTRREVIELLRRKPCSAGELAQLATVSPPALSRHLRVLRTNGLIEDVRDERDGRLRIYRLRRERFADLETWLAHMLGFWDEQMGAFKDYVEETRVQKK